MCLVSDTAACSRLRRSRATILSERMKNSGSQAHLECNSDSIKVPSEDSEKGSGFAQKNSSLCRARARACGACFMEIILRNRRKAPVSQNNLHFWRGSAAPEMEYSS